MGGYANFKKRMNAGGTTYRSEQIENSKRLLEYTFADDPSYVPEGCPVWYSDRVLHPRLYDFKYKTTLPFQAKIQTLIHEPIYMGDIIPWNKDNGYWLCVGVTNIGDINWQGNLQYCNYKVKFVSLFDGEIREYPISMYNATQYGTGETDRRLLDIGSSAHIIFMPYDEHTVLLDNGNRFLIDRNLKMPTAYKITQIDASSYSDSEAKHGYLRIYVLEDRLDPKVDDVENMVANAWENKIGTASELQDDNTKWI